MLDVVTTVGDLVGWGETELGAAGVAEAGREARELFAACVCGTSSDAWLRRAEPAPVALRARFEAAVGRRTSGWPPAYAAGRACFRGHWLAVDDRVLIPRPETEGLAELVIRWAQAYWRAAARLPLVADIGTGSGCIAISLALEAPVAGVLATDVSAEALNLALENTVAAGVKERVSLRRGDLLAPLLDDRVDVVVSNPPYIATGEWERLEPVVRDCEPRLALDGGVDGLGQTRRLLMEARGALFAGGLLAVEIDARRGAASAALATAAGFEDVEVGSDLFGRPRYLTGRQPGAA